MLVRRLSQRLQRLFDRGPQVGVLFVCAANLCRSPMAEQVLRAYAARSDAGSARGLRLHVASAGVRVGRSAEPPDARALDALRRRGYALRKTSRSRALTTADFDRFDLLLAMDGDVHATMLELAPLNRAHKLKRLLDLAPGLQGQDVPDPYWGDLHGFEQVLDLCEAAAPGVMAAAKSCLESKRDALDD
jgi:protein-tyrosine phosphatase